MSYKPKGSAPIIVLHFHITNSSLEMVIPRVTQALSISASMVFYFVALVLMLNFRSKAVTPVTRQ